MCWLINWLMVLLCRFSSFGFSLRAIGLLAVSDMPFLSNWQCEGTTFPLRFTNISQEIFHHFALAVTVVAVLQFSQGYSHTLKILLYLYIYLYIYKDRVNFWLSYNLFWNCNTATTATQRRHVYFLWLNHIIMIKFL